MRKGVLLVGLGNIGLKYDLHLEEGSFVHTHARAFERHKEFILLGAVDDNLECRDVFTKIYEKPAYIDLFEALQVHKPDLVVIATPTSSHFKILSNILKKSSPRIILCEKPLSNNLIEAQKMVNECDKRDIDLFVNYMRRSDAGVIKVKNLIDSENFKIDLKGVAW